MKKRVFALNGDDLKEIDLDDEVFNAEISHGSIYYAIQNELANQRIGTASTKTRGEIRGTSRKPWRQKGTGRARAGRRRSPIWVGGGITFGPKPRNFGYTIPRKAKRVAIKSILSLKNREDKLKIVKDFDVESGKTKDLLKILKNLTSNERVTFILNGETPMLKRAGSNIPWLTLLSYNRLRAHDIYYSRDLLVMESAALKLGEIYGKRGG